MRVLVNPAYAPGRVPPSGDEARSFHRALSGYSPTPLRPLASASFGELLVKDETVRFGLPAFKILGASWAVERVLLERPDARTLVTASAGNHGRAVAHAAAQRGLACRVFVPERSLRARREAIAAEGAEVIVVDGAYEATVAAAALDAARPGNVELADVGESAAAHLVIDGYATLFAEIAEQTPGPIDMLLVPVGVGSLAAAAARFGAAAGVRVVGVEPVDAACLTASLAAGTPTMVSTPGTSMAGMDCAEVSAAAWSSLLPGIAGTILVDDQELAAGRRALADAGIPGGECSAAGVVAARILASEEGAPLLARRRDRARVVLLATEGETGVRPSGTPPA